LKASLKQDAIMMQYPSCPFCPLFLVPKSGGGEHRRGERDNIFCCKTAHCFLSPVGFATVIKILRGSTQRGSWHLHTALSLTMATSMGQPGTRGVASSGLDRGQGFANLLLLESGCIFLGQFRSEERFTTLPCWACVCVVGGGACFRLFSLLVPPP